MDHNSFNCELCPYSCKWINKLHKHIQNVHVEQLNCRYKDCTFITKVPTELKSHLKTHSAITFFSCSYCNYKCVRKSKLKIHLRTHTDTEKGEKQVDINACNLVSNSLNDLTQRTLTQNEERFGKSNEATDANIIAGSRNRRQKRRRNIYFGYKSFACAFCKFYSHTKEALTSHMKIYHNDLESFEKRFQCSVCEFQTNLKVDLNAHMITHTDTKELEELSTFNCGQCDSKFASKSSHKKHFIIKHQSTVTTTEDSNDIKEADIIETEGI